MKQLCLINTNQITNTDASSYKLIEEYSDDKYRSKLQPDTHEEYFKA